MEILHWPVSSALREETEIHYRSALARRLVDQEPLAIIRRITFDNVAPEITVGEVKRLFQYISRHFLPELSGLGLEVGAGPGTFSSILASYPKVEKIYALEVCQPIVELLAPKITKYILGSNENKVIGVVGDFNSVNLPTGSVNFAFDFFSLHHSSDLSVTLKEIHRILKPGGFIFCLDKARPDYFTKEDLDELLDAEYDASSKTELLGVPSDKKFTRRMNGEKEYRLKDWQAAFRGAGFKRVEHFHLAKTVGPAPVLFIKSALAILPPQIQVLISRFMPSPKRSHKFILDSHNRIFVKEVKKFPKEISLLIAYA